jgi:hypothetical protein
MSMSPKNISDLDVVRTLEDDEEIPKCTKCKSRNLHIIEAFDGVAYHRPNL